MKILFISISLLIISLSCCSQSPDTIRWTPYYKLKWEDFQGRPDSASSYKAVTIADIFSTLSYNNSTFNLKATCSFYKKKSWALGTGQNLLSHEQGHFNIAELFTRKLRMAFKEYKFNPKTIEADYNNIFSRIKAERAKMDASYDHETNLSRNKSKQVAWNKKIEAELKKLEKYSD